MDIWSVLLFLIVSGLTLWFCWVMIITTERVKDEGGI